MPLTVQARVSRAGAVVLGSCGGVAALAAAAIWWSLRVTPYEGRSITFLPLAVTSVRCRPSKSADGQLAGGRLKVAAPIVRCHRWSLSFPLIPPLGRAPWRSSMTVDNDLHDFATDAEIDALVEQTLQDVGVTLDDLRSQASQGRFASEKLRRAWFAIDGVGRA